MNIEHDNDRIKDEQSLTKERGTMTETHEEWEASGFPDEGALDPDDWLDTSKACNLEDGECEACQ